MLLTEAVREQQMPVIDMAVLELEDGPASGSKKMSEYLARACETWGFFHLINHGIDASLLEMVKEFSIGFFKQPEEEKLEYKIGPGIIEGFYSRDLTAVGSNKLTHSVDHLFYFTTPVSKNYLARRLLNRPAYRETMTEYALQVRLLSEKLVGILSEELGLGRGELEARMAGGPAKETAQSIRTNFYSPEKAAEAGDLCLLQPHSDPGALTVLLQNDVAGFEVKKDGLWVAVEPIADAFVVNIGDQIEILSNGRYKSIEHRGNAHRTKERLSIATFLLPDLEAVICPMEDLVDSAHPALYKTIKYQDYYSNFIMEGLNGKKYVNAAGLGAEDSQ